MHWNPKVNILPKLSKLISHPTDVWILQHYEIHENFALTTLSLSLISYEINIIANFHVPRYLPRLPYINYGQTLDRTLKRLETTSFSSSSHLTVRKWRIRTQWKFRLIQQPSNPSSLIRQANIGGRGWGRWWGREIWTRVSVSLHRACATLSETLCPYQHVGTS